MVLADNAVMVSECGPWSGCRLGAHCPQAVTQQVGDEARIFLGPACPRNEGL